MYLVDKIVSERARSHGSWRARHDHGCISGFGKKSIQP